MPAVSLPLSGFPIDEHWQRHAVASDLRLLMEVVARAIKAISAHVGGDDARERTLDVVPTSLPQRVALFLGSGNEVKMAKRYHAG